MIYKFKNGGTVKLQGAWSKIPKIINKTIKNIRGADGKIFHSQIVRNPNNFYRAVGKDAILDAKKSGLIRGNPLRTNDNYPFFARAKEPFYWHNYVIEGTPDSSDWISAYPYVYSGNKEIVKIPKVPDRDYSLGYDTPIGKKESNGFQLTGGSDLNFLKGYEVFPITLNKTPTTNFKYWQKHPLIGWRLHEF